MSPDEIPLPLALPFRLQVAGSPCLESEHGTRKLLPDGKIIRSNRQPAKFEHVSARFGHQSDLCPGDLIDGQLDFPFTFGHFAVASTYFPALWAE
jgi:hypothetical protein